MTFYEISMKMLLANFRRYRLYFLCNLFAAVLFYSFAALATDRRFMDIRIVDSMISGNIIAPTLFAGVFLALFIPYFYGAFLRNRKREYGVLMALGMSEGDVLKNMIAEACTVAALSLLCGLALGTGVSYLFYAFVQKVIGVAALQWQWNADAYRLTTLVYGAAMLLTLATALIGFKKASVVELLKEKFKAEGKGSRASPWFFAAGIILVAASVAIMLIGYCKTTDGWILASLGTMFAGSYLAFTQWGSLEKHLAKWTPGFRQRHFLGLSLARQHGRSRRRIRFIAAWMIGFSVFFTGFGAAMAPSLMRNALAQTPYGLVYSQIFGKNQVGDAEVESLLNRYGVSVQSLRQAEYLRSKAFNVLSASEANQTFGCDYAVGAGKFLEVFQFDPKDGYGHDTAMPNSFAFNCAGETLELHPAGSDFRILFNGNPTFADFTLVVSDADYARLASQCRDFWKGTMKLYTLNNWQDSSRGVSAVQNLLAQKNNADESEQRYYRATSRIETYSTAQNSSGFFLFVMAFIVALFCGASFLIVLFKLRAESEEERRVLSGLHRIGVTQDEMRSMLRTKNMLYFLPQVFAGLPIGVFFICMVAGSYGYGATAAVFSLLAGLTLFALNWLGSMNLAHIKI